MGNFLTKNSFCYFENGPYTLVTVSVLRQQNTTITPFLQQPYNHIKWYRCIKAIKEENHKFKQSFFTKKNPKVINFIKTYRKKIPKKTYFIEKSD